MDFPGAQWPYQVLEGITVVGLVLLGVVAWLWAGADRPAPAVLRGLFAWWAAAVVLLLTRDLFLLQVAGRGLVLPGADWEYVRPPTDPVNLGLFVVVGGVHPALVFGTPLAALLATVRTLVAHRTRLRQHA